MKKEKEYLEVEVVDDTFKSKVKDFTVYKINEHIKNIKRIILWKGIFFITFWIIILIIILIGMFFALLWLLPDVLAFIILAIIYVLIIEIFYRIFYKIYSFFK